MVKMILALFLLPLSYYFSLHNPLKPLQVEKQNSAVSWNKHFFNTFNLGNRRMLSDLFWIQTLIEADLSRYKINDLNSWLFIRFDLITDLDPKFYEVYLLGGKYLSVITDDKQGASAIFSKGLNLYPYDFSLNYYMALHALIELKDMKKGYEHLQRIENDPYLPYFMKSLFIKLKGNLFGKEEAYKMILKAYNDEDEKSPLKQFWKNKLKDY